MNLNLRVKFSAELAADFAAKLVSTVRHSAICRSTIATTLSNLGLCGDEILQRGATLRGCILYRRVRALRTRCIAQPKYTGEINLIAALNFKIAFAFRTVRCGGIAKF